MVLAVIWIGFDILSLVPVLGVCFAVFASIRQQNRLIAPGQRLHYILLAEQMVSRPPAGRENRVCGVLSGSTPGLEQPCQIRCETPI
jgi:hypothetical protein